MSYRVDMQSVGKQFSHEICWWLTVVAGVDLCLWK
jgi:hypothetical protein